MTRALASAAYLHTAVGRMTHYSHAHPTARKEHYCEMCSRIIRKGETYMRGAGFGDGEAWTWKVCAHCDPLTTYVFAQSSEYEYSSDLLVEWEPQTLHEARLRAMHHRKWTRGDGSLYPVPTLVRTYDKNGFGWPTGVELA